MHSLSSEESKLLGEALSVSLQSQDNRLSDDKFTFPFQQILEIADLLCSWRLVSSMNRYNMIFGRERNELPFLFTHATQTK